MDAKSKLARKQLDAVKLAKGPYPICTCEVERVEYTDYIEFCPLHAAAPNMYEALKELREWCDNNINGVPMEYGKIMARADAALLKAEGR
jgi:hypothetical protein